MDTQMQDTQRATYACVQCRTLKRKCTRELPNCSLCVRLHKICDYSTTNAYAVPPVNEGNGFRDWKPIGLSTNFSVVSHGTFPARFFLNSATHQQLSINIIPTISTSSDTIALFGSTEDIQYMCDKYFSEVQNWLPFLRRERIARRVHDLIVGCDIRLALLLLCMKLVTTTPSYQQDAITSLLYQAVRDLSARVESACLISLELIQANILLSMYEMAHGIYPAGFLSIGRAARLCTIVGLHDRMRAPQLFKEPETWAMLEEERRTWWAVLILDRFSQIGIFGLQLAPEPTSDELLPCTESQWDNDEVGINEKLFHRPLTPDSRIGDFANMCQSVHILGRVLEHRNHIETCVDTHIRLAEGQQLHETLAALTKHLTQKYSEEGSTTTGCLLGAMSLCYSARLVLYNVYVSSEYEKTERYQSEESALFDLSLSGMEQMIRGIHELAHHVASFKDGKFVSFGPLICHTLYQGATVCARLGHEHKDQDKIESLISMVDSLKVLGRRWKVVDEFLNMLKDEGSLELIDS